MKSIKFIISAICAAVLLSCSVEEEKLIATIDGETTISTADSDLVLTIDNADAIALTIFWDELGQVSLSDPNASIASSAVVNAVQFSLSDDFAQFTAYEVDSSYDYVRLTVSELNVIVIGLGATPGEANTVYFRICSSIGESDSVCYSNVLSINVTPYDIDMSILTITGTSSGEVYVNGADGRYQGFINVPAEWWNCYFYEGDGSVYGAYTSGNPFLLTTDSDMWNVWFPSPSGCYYVDINTSSLSWTAAAAVDMTVTVGGDVQYMNYSKSAFSYYLTTSLAAGDELQVDYISNLYSTSDSDYVETTYALVCSADGSISLASEGTSTGLSASSAGDYTLVLSLEDGTWSLTSGSVEVGGSDDDDIWPTDADYAAVTGDYLYMYDTSGNTIATLSRVSNGKFTGSYSISGWENFFFGDAANYSDATIVYGSAPTSSIDGAVYRLFSKSAGSWNIWWPYSYAADIEITVNTNVDERSWSYSLVYASVTDSYIYMYDADLSTLKATFSSISTGVFYGQYTFSSWENFKFGNNEDPAYADIVYGSYPADGGDNVYTLYCGSDMWNIWWPSGDEATVYLTIDTVNGVWSYSESEREEEEEEEEDVDDGWVVASGDYLYVLDNSDWSSIIATLNYVSTGIYEGTVTFTAWQNFVLSTATSWSEDAFYYGSYPASGGDNVYTLYDAQNGGWNIWWPSDAGATVTMHVDTNSSARSWSYTEQ